VVQLTKFTPRRRHKFGEGPAANAQDVCRRP
jgi:hypothetical protein